MGLSHAARSCRPNASITRETGQPVVLDALDTALLDLLQRDASLPVRTGSAP